MATPTPTHPSNPSSASKRATGHVLTPCHLGLSPAPRSLPSPAATRKDQAGNTPVNHPTMSSHGSKIIGGTPMGHSLSQQGNTVGSSPGANMLSFGTPVGLGVEGITPGHFNMPTPGMAGVPMSLTMSDLGVTSSAGAQKRNEDEERRVKMRKVLKSIGKPKGRISEESIARIGRRVGFEYEFDSVSAEERSKDNGNRRFSMAGKILIIDVTLKDQRPENVAAEPPSVHAQAVRSVLLDDLQGAGEVMLDTKLDRFAADLERLACIDRLSSQHIDCFEALSGILNSLRRLHEQELLAAKDLEVLRKRSGKPAVHADGEIGFKIAYWQDGRDNASTESTSSGGTGTFKLSLGIERSSAGLYPSIRVSDNWLPNPLELPVTVSEQTIPWQDPPPTLIPASTDGDAMAIDGDQRLPDLRFTAQLDPPVVVPWQMASNMLQSFGLPVPQLFVYPALWHAILLDPSASTPFNALSDPMTSTEQSVLSARNGEEIEITHSYTLDVAKRDGGYKVEELPFSHPRQLIDLLPTLRQWTCFGSLVKSAFALDTRPRDVPGVHRGTRVDRNPQAPLSLEDLLTPPTTPPFGDHLPVSVSLATSPIPTLSFRFPTAMDKPVCKLTVQVLLNGELTVVSAEGFLGKDEMEGIESTETKKLAKALEACGDVGVWIEWLRMRTK